jgi:hypothetical protein
MKKIVLLLVAVCSLNVFADTIKVDLSAKTKLQNSEQAALEAGLKIEAKIDAGKYRNRGAENFNCEFGADAEYSKKNIEVKKLYVSGKAKYQAIVNLSMECEEEYMM